MSHEESSEERDFSALVPDAPILSEDNVPPGRIPPPSRKSKGGMGAMLGHLFAVVLGGVTVFGVYFLFLEDLLKPPERAKLQSSPEPAQTASEKRHPLCLVLLLLPTRLYPLCPRQDQGIQRPIANSRRTEPWDWPRKWRVKIPKRRKNGFAK